MTHAINISDLTIRDVVATAIYQRLMAINELGDPAERAVQSYREADILLSARIQKDDPKTYRGNI